MDPYVIAVGILGGAVLGTVVWVLAKLGEVLIKAAEALAAAAVVVLVLWLMVKAAVWAIRQVVIHWRTSLTLLATLAWWQWWGWASMTLSTVEVVGVFFGWRLIDIQSCDAWVDRV